MNTTGHFDQEDLALFAMKLLPSDEASAIEQHISSCEECRQELAAVLGDLGIYAQSVELHAPAAQARERLLKQVATEKKIVPITPTERLAAQPFSGRSGTLFGTDIASATSSSYADEDESRKSGTARALAWLGWTVAACLAVGAGKLYRQGEALRSTVTSQSLQVAQLTADAASARQIMDVMTDSSAKRVTLNRAQTAPVPQGRVTYLANKGALIFLANNMEPLQPSKTYELWLIPANGLDPIPAGTFHPDEHGNANVIMPPLPKDVEAKAFGVTIEDQGGSTTPTLPIIMVGS